MDFKIDILFWNELVTVNQPRISDVRVVLERYGLPLTPVVSSDMVKTTASGFIYINVAERNLPDPCIQSVGLVFSPEYFRNDLQNFFSPIQTSCSLFGIELKGSAISFWKKLRKANLVPYDLMTDMESYKIIYGSSLIVEFIPTIEIAIDPSESTLGALQYNFGPRYSGKKKPVLEQV